MTYTVISHREVCGKTKGDTITAKELQDAGISPETLAAGNHIKASNTTAQIPSIKNETEEGATK
jgi:predicted methyltransferase